MNSFEAWILFLRILAVLIFLWFVAVQLWARYKKHLRFSWLDRWWGLALLANLGAQWFPFESWMYNGSLGLSIVAIVALIIESFRRAWLHKRHMTELKARQMELERLIPEELIASHANTDEHDISKGV